MTDCHQDAAGQKRHERRRVLVVDDNLDSAESMGLLLELEGHQVHFAHDGPQAMREAASFRPNVVLLDIGLPGWNGYEVAKRIRAETWGRDVLLVAITGWGRQADRDRSQEAGFDLHLVKPADLQAVMKVLASSQAPFAEHP